MAQLEKHSRTCTDRSGHAVQDCIYPWVVKHGEFLLNRYLIHADGLTSFRRRWDKDYTSGLCEFGECVLFRTPGSLRETGNTAWFKGLGRDTEADENIVFNGTEIVKVRTIKRNVPSAQWDRELFLTLASTPWDPKGKNTEDTSLVLPSTLTHCYWQNATPTWTRF